MYAVIVPLGVQDRLPRPSVSIVYPIDPPSIATLLISPKSTRPPASPPLLTQLVPSYARTCPSATDEFDMFKFPTAPSI